MNAKNKNQPQSGMSTAPLLEDADEALDIFEPTPPAASSAPVTPTVPVAVTDPTADLMADPTDLDVRPDDDPFIDSLVDEISVSESDELLAARDGRLAHAAAAVEHQQSGLRAHVAAFFGGWWHNKLARYGTVLVLLTAIAGLGAIPTSRYVALNSVGVRSAASLTIIDNTTQLPLKNVSVELGDNKAKSNEDGVVKLYGLKLGTQSLAVSQAGFATINKTVTLGFGSNPLGDFTLDAVGTQFRFKLTDFLSGKAITEAEISSGDANAQADKKGQLVLTVGLEDSAAQQATIKADGYRSELVSLETADGKPSKQNQSITMVPSQKEVYISKQSGKYDLYKVDLDGKNKTLLLAAAGQEDADITVAVSPDGQQAALVSRRDDTQNQDGYRLQTLTMVDVENGSKLMLDHSERIQIVDWIGNRVIYVKIKAGTSAGNPERYQLMSYDYDTTSRLQLATANSFNDVISAQGAIYFASSNNYQGGASQLVKINADSTGKQVVLDKIDTYNIARSSYDSFDISAYDAQYQFKIGESEAKKVSESSTAATETKFYLDAKNGTHSLWTDSRDGKGVLLAYNSQSGKDTLLATASGLTYPVRWLNARTIVYRVATSSETADYAVSLDGGAPKKITDLTSTAGLGQWNYR